LLVGVAKGSRRAGDDVFACLHVNSGVNPGRASGELNFLQEPTLAQGGGRGSCTLCRARGC
jgi:hypothetical protein